MEQSAAFVPPQLFPKCAFCKNPLRTGPPTGDQAILLGLGWRFQGPRRVGSRRESGPKTFESNTGDPSVVNGMLWISVPEIVLDQAEVVALIREVEAA